jgi:hypothetical protein
MDKESNTINLSSNVLFHFTNGKEKLIGILKNGFLAKPCVEYSPLETSTDSIPTRLPIQATPMVSFCDIPLALIRGHLSYYGDYAIGLTKEWGIEKGVTPVFYVHHKSIIFPLIKKVLPIDKIVKKPKDSSHNILDIMPYLKNYVGFECREINNPKIGDMDLYNADDKGNLRKYEPSVENTKTSECWRIKSRKFYDEREWRYVPSSENTIGKEIFTGIYTWEKIKDRKTGINDFAKDIGLELPSIISTTSENPFTLKFTMDNIKFIIVKEESEIEEILEILKKLYEDNPAELKKMVSVPILSAKALLHDISI